MQKPYLHNLTSLRGIAAILVAILHFHFFMTPVASGNTAHVIDKFYLMVDLFFILSGFIMCYVYNDSFINGIEKRSYKNFLIARLARIYPLHVVTIGAEVLVFLSLLSKVGYDNLGPFKQHLYRLDGILVQLGFLQTVGIFNFDTWNAPAWSLSAEWWAYVLFPFLFIVFSKLKGFKQFLPIVIAIIGWILIEFVLSAKEPFMDFPLNPNKRTLDVNWHYGTLRGIVGFICGMGIWLVFEKLKFKPVLGNGWTLVVTGTLVIISMMLGWYDVISVFLLGTIILISAYGSKNMDRFYAFPILTKLGNWSFSIYIWHNVIIHVILIPFNNVGTNPKKAFQTYTQDIPSFLSLIAFLLITSLVGWLSFKFIERPTRQWIKRRFSS
ncbi:acyltransferase family protein [Seonamhaeicola marinus]|uniref:Acyltransferase n=1 Tax=Seonamhaeicola marinus TaxID=1912246 RepID=A0A5D0IYV6_9FLAO|nr:acyltransferase [Seonamhaeicola marinus]TYA86782.1 acyltransferase [Seonamhaeicola marinus]